MKKALNRVVQGSNADDLMMQAEAHGLGVREAVGIITSPLLHHPRPWIVVDPNGNEFGYRPIFINDARRKRVLFVGDAGLTPHVLYVAHHIVGCVNKEHTANHFMSRLPRILRRPKR